MLFPSGIVMSCCQGDLLRACATQRTFFPICSYAGLMLTNQPSFYRSNLLTMLCTQHAVARDWHCQDEGDFEKEEEITESTLSSPVRNSRSFSRYWLKVERQLGTNQLRLSMKFEVAQGEPTLLVPQSINSIKNPITKREARIQTH